MSIETVSPTPQGSELDATQQAAKHAARAIIEGEVVAGQLENTAWQSAWGARSAVEEAGGDTTIDKHGIRGSKELVERSSVRQLKVHDTSFSFAPGESLSDVTPDSSTEKAVVSASSTLSEGPARGLGLLKLPDHTKGHLRRTSQVASLKPRTTRPTEIEQTADGELLPGSKTTKIKETVYGSRRRVEREVTTGKDKAGKVVIHVKQVATDLNGDNPRTKEFTHSGSNPTRRARHAGRNVSEIDQAQVARKIAKRVNARVASNIPRGELYDKPAAPDSALPLPTKVTSAKPRPRDLGR